MFVPAAAQRLGMALVDVRRPGSVPATAFVDLRVLDEMGLLPKSFLAHLAPKRFLARVRAQVNLDVAFVQEPAVAYMTVMDGPFPSHIAI